MLEHLEAPRIVYRQIARLGELQQRPQYATDLWVVAPKGLQKKIKLLDQSHFRHQRNLKPNCVSLAGNAFPIVPNADPEPENWFGA